MLDYMSNKNILDNLLLKIKFFNTEYLVLNVSLELLFFSIVYVSVPFVDMNLGNKKVGLNLGPK